MGAFLTHRLRQGVLHALAGGRSFTLLTLRNERAVTEWTKVQELRSGKHTLWDHCFEVPSTLSSRTGAGRGTGPAPVVIHRIQEGVSPRAELYDFPGEYAQRFDGVDKGGSNSPLPGHPGPILYVGRKDGGVCIHGLATFNRPGCIVVTQGWVDLFRAVAGERELSFAIEV